MTKTYADDAVRSNDLDKLVSHAALGVTLAIRVDVAQVTNVALLVSGSTVGLAVRVEVRPSRGAAVGVVAKGVDVEAALGVGVVAGDVPGDGGGRVLVGLLEGNGAGDLGVTTENGYCWNRVSQWSHKTMDNKVS